MINFDTLPTGRPTNTVAPGPYYLTIEDAIMKDSKTPGKAPYLNLKYSLQDANKENKGIVYDIIAESEHKLMQYKLKRLLIATALKFKGSFELKDLQKVLPNKQMIGDITLEPAKDGRPEKNVIDIFKSDIYYPLSEASTIFPNSAPIAANDADDSTTEEAPSTDSTPIEDNF